MGSLKKKFHVEDLIVLVCSRKADRVLAQLF